MTVPRVGARRMGLLLRVALLAALPQAGCGGAAPLPPPVEGDAPRFEEAPAADPIDLARVVWPATPEPLPSDVPWWANDFTTPGQSPAHRPNLPDASASYARLLAPSRPGELGPTVIYCEVSNTGGPSDPTPQYRDAGRAHADLTVLGRMGPALPFQAIAPDNATSFVFGIPVQALRVGDGITLRVLDRDFIAHDEVGRLEGTYTGVLPITLDGEGLRASCVAEAQGLVQSYASSLFYAADQAIARHVVAPPSVEAGIPRIAWGRFEAARQAVSYAADWLTWTHPKVQLRRARVDALLRAHEAEQRAAFAERVAATRDLAEVQLPSGGWVRAVQVTCGRRTGSPFERCWARVAIHDVTPIPPLQAVAYSRTRDGRIAYAIPVTERSTAGEQQLEFELAPFDALLLRQEAPLILEMRESAAGTPCWLGLPALTPSP